MRITLPTSNTRLRCTGLLVAQGREHLVSSVNKKKCVLAEKIREALKYTVMKK